MYGKFKRSSFNTQPPEGGWMGLLSGFSARTGFNTQPPEGGWEPSDFVGSLYEVSTHSRLKAAGILSTYSSEPRGFNTQPPEGGWSLSQKPYSIRFRSPDFAKLSRKAEMQV